MIKWRKFLLGPGSASKGRAGFVGLVDTSTFNAAGVGSITTAAKDLLTAVLKANALYKNGMGVRIRAAGSFAGNGNNKNIFIRLGSTTIFDSGVLTDNGTTWICEVILRRTGTDTQFSSGYIIGGTAIRAQNRTSGLTLDDGADQTIAVRAAQDTAADDTVANDLQVEILTL